MELRLNHIIHLYNVFHENDGNGNCAQFIEEEFYKMFDKNLWMMSMSAMLLVWTPWISIVLMMIALVMMKMSPINMPNFAECIGFVSTHSIGKIDIARGIST